MSTLNDPGMKEIVHEFCSESNNYLVELEDVLEKLEDDISDNSGFENFGQIIDRIMGAAKSLGAEEIATFCELGKIIGYKSSQVKEPALLRVVVAILIDSVHILKLMIEQLEKGESELLKGLNTKTFATRLKWLSEKFKHIDRASVEIDPKEKAKEETAQTKIQNEIDLLLESLGL